MLIERGPVRISGFASESYETLYSVWVETGNGRGEQHDAELYSLDMGFLRGARLGGAAFSTARNTSSERPGIAYKKTHKAVMSIGLLVTFRVQQLPPNLPDREGIADTEVTVGKRHNLLLLVSGRRHTGIQCWNQALAQACAVCSPKFGGYECNRDFSTVAKQEPQKLSARTRKLLRRAPLSPTHECRSSRSVSTLPAVAAPNRFSWCPWK